MEKCCDGCIDAAALLLVAAGIRGDRLHVRVALTCGLDGTPYGSRGGSRPARLARARRRRLAPAAWPAQRPLQPVQRDDAEGTRAPDCRG
jgi:hypothetical protein